MAKTEAKKRGAKVEPHIDEIIDAWGPATEEVPVELEAESPPATPLPPATLDELRKKKKPRSEAVTVTLDQESSPTTVVMRFQAIGSKRWETLLADHPPTDAQQREHLAEQEKVGIPLQARRRLQWNVDTFPPALIAACIVEPKLTVAQAEELWESEAWNAGELDAIFSAAVRVNTTASSVQLGPAGSLAEVLARIRAS